MQQVTDPSIEMLKYIEAKRDWVRNHYTPETIGEYETVEGKLTLLDVILKSGWIDKSETVNLQSLGITFGDIIVQDMKFVWVEVEDEYGTDPAVMLPDTTLIIYPMTMISKRFERGETVDIYELYDALKIDIDRIELEA